MPAMTTLVYGGGLAAAMGISTATGRDFSADTFKITLHTSTYTPTITHSFQSDLTNELGTAGGYTSGGLTVTSPAISITVANSWGTVAATSTAYSVGDVVRPSAGNLYLYRAVVAGTSGGSAPTWPTVVGTTVADGTVTWLNIGTAGIKFTSTNPTWASFSAGPFRSAVLADTTPGSAATNPLICAMSFASDQTGGGGAFDITLSTSAGYFVIGVS
jgi:hypothetical protein